MGINLHVFLSLSFSLSLSLYIYIYIHNIIYIYIMRSVLGNTCWLIYLNSYINTHTHLYIYIYIYTHTQSYLHTQINIDRLRERDMSMTLNYIWWWGSSPIRIWSTPSLPLLLGLLWSGVVVAIRVLSNGQIEPLREDKPSLKSQTCDNLREQMYLSSCTSTWTLWPLRSWSCFKPSLPLSQRRKEEPMQQTNPCASSHQKSLH